MGLNAAALEVLIAKGLSAEDILDVARALERKKDNTAAERQARARAKKKTSRRDSHAVTPPIDNNHTPRVISSYEETTQPQVRREVFPKPDWCDDDQVWSDFLANRKRKRLPNTASAYKGFLDDIARISDDEWPPGRLLRHAAVKGWGGIYDPRETKKSGTGNVKQFGNSNQRTAELAQAKMQSLG